MRKSLSTSSSPGKFSRKSAANILPSSSLSVKSVVVMSRSTEDAVFRPLPNGWSRGERAGATAFAEEEVGADGAGVGAAEDEGGHVGVDKVTKDAVFRPLPSGWSRGERAGATAFAEGEVGADGAG